MRSALLPLLISGVLAALAGCKPAEKDDGAAGSAGAAGSSQAGSGGSAGSAAGSAGASGSSAGSGGSAGSSAGSGGSAGSTAGSAGSGGDAGAGGSAGSSAGSAGSAGSCQSLPANAADVCGDIPTAGKCKDASNIITCVIPDSPCEQAKILEKACPSGWSCKATDEGASCVPNGDCIEGDTRCKGLTSMETCTGGKWAESACQNGEACTVTSNKPAGCGVQASADATGDKYTLSGLLQYEFRYPNADRTGMGDLQTDGAFYVLIAAWSGEEYVGGTITDTEGKFSIEMTKPPSADTHVYAFPMSFSYDGTQPLSAVAHVPRAADNSFDTDSDDMPGYWSFTYPGAIDGSTKELGDWTVKEADGSAAIWIFQWMEFGYRRLHDKYPDTPQMSAVTVWDPGVKFPCGACFHPPGLGAPRVALGGGQYDNYNTRFSFTGTEGTPKHWQRSSIGHEFGHYVMSNYSLAPGEGGPHALDDVSAPGLAYSEGWGTFFGQRNMSDDSAGAEGLENVYFSVAGDTYWWYDLDKVADPDSHIPLCNPSGDISQPLSEAIVTHVMWNLWAPETNGTHHHGLGDDALFGGLVSERTKSKALNRGYKTVDMVDFLDGMTCTSEVTGAPIDQQMARITHPYQAASKVCQLGPGGGGAGV